MANELVRFTMGTKTDLGTKTKEAGQILFVLNDDNKSGSIYLDKDATHRIRMSHDLKDTSNSFSESAVNVTTYSGKVYPVALDADGYLAVSVPWTNTTYSAGTGLTLASGNKFNHTNSVTAGTASGSATKTLTFGDTFTIPTVTYDAQGHITGKGTTTMTMPALNVSNATAGTLAVARGGTGTTTVNKYAVVYGNSAGNAYSSTQGAAGSYLVGGGASAAPSWHTPAELRNAIGLGNTTGVLSIAYGGTGGNDFASARTNLGVNKLYSGVCSTDAGVAIKAVTCPNFVLEKGAVIFVTFDNTNTAAVANLKLDVNSTGDKPIKVQYNDSITTAVWGAGYIKANETYLFYYDGTNWIQITNYNSNTTYSAMSVDEAKAGTATSSRTIRADYLKTFLSTLGGTGLTFTHDATNGIVLDHSNSITAGTASGSATGTVSFGGTITIPSISYDSEGHITSTSTTTLTLPSNPNVDTKVNQTNTTGNDNYRVLFSGTADDTTRAEGARKNTSFKYNPSTTTLSVPKINTTGDISITNIAETDKFLNFSYAGADAAGASWRLGHLGSGSADTNYFVIQSGTSTTNATTWNNVLRLGMNTYDATFSGNVNPAVTNTKTLGTSSLKWANVYATTFTGNLSGTATTATTANKLGTNAGSSTQPVYFSGGIPVAITGAIANDISGNAATATSAANADAADKLNTDAGSSTQPVYFNNGIPVAITGALANDITGNAATATSATSAATAAVANKLGTTTVGGVNKPIYLSNGAATEANTYAGGTAVTLNGSSKASSTASFYAPTGAGTSGQYLKSSGSGAPTWANFPTSMTPTSHSHGNITNDGKVSSTNTALAADDFIVIGDSSDTGKIIRGPAFDAATATKALTQKGTWETFTANTGTVTSVATGTGLTGGPITTSGTISLADSGVTAASYGNAANATVSATGGTFKTTYLTVDAKGRITAASDKTMTVSVGNGTITNAMLVNSSMSIAGSTISLGGTLSADTLRTNLGLSSAMHYRGKATVAISDGGTQDPTITGYDFTNDKMAGDVIIDSSSSMEYVWSGTAWERLGSETSFKTIQTAKSSPSASGNTTAFIDTISQDSNGVITATKKNVTTASTSAAGIIQITKANLNSFINTLDTGSSTPVDADYYISQYVNGGTTTTTYHRRPMSALWAYIKGKINATTDAFSISISGNAATATTANKIGTNAGSSSQPVYFANGVPVAITGAIANNTTGKAASADKLNTNAGSSSQPVYFSGGIPIAITGAIANDTTGNAATATTATNALSANKLNTNAGTTYNPVYFDGGIPAVTSGYTVEYIVGTQTGATNAWTGVTKDAALYDGKMIMYVLPQAGTGTAATLNLTLSDGTTSGAKGIYRYGNTTGITTHYAAGSRILLIYDATNGRWNSSAWYDSNTNTLLRVYSSATNISVPLIGQSSANSTTAAWSTYTGTYKDWYGAIPNDDAKRAKINLSTGAMTVPGGITANVVGTLTGNANSATKLQTARTINGTSFDGTGNITTANWGTARNVSISDSDETNTGTAVSVNGSANVILKLPATIKATLAGNAATATSATTASTATLATSAQKFDTNRTIALTGDTTGSASSNGASGWSIATTTKKLSQTTTTALSSFTDTSALIYTAAGGSNTITDKPTSVDAFGALSFKTADGWYGQLLMSSNTATGIYWRTATSLSGGWKKILDSTNYTDYTVTKTGSGASGSWGISITGNAATATTASKLGTASAGSTTKPIYWANGIPAEANTYAGGTAVTLNGTSAASSTASFYAPTTAGTSGYYLKSNGSGAPTWTAFPTSLTPTSHSHGNITNAGTMNPSQITIANNDFIVVGDADDSTGKITKGPIFDGSTTTSVLSQKGTWTAASPSVSITAGTSSDAPKVNITVLGASGTAQALTKASTSVYGVTKLSSTASSSEEGLAATPKGVQAAIDALDVSDSAVNGQYVKQVTQTNGKITVTRADFAPSISITAGTSSAAPKVNVTVNTKSGTAQSITTATTGVYGVTKLSSTSSTSEEGLAATPKGVWNAIDTVKYKVTQTADANNAEYHILLKKDTTATDQTDTVKFNSKTENFTTINPSTGTISATSYKVASKVQLQYDATTESLNFVFI